MGPVSRWAALPCGLVQKELRPLFSPMIDLAQTLTELTSLPIHDRLRVVIASGRRLPVRP